MANEPTLLRKFPELAEHYRASGGLNATDVAIELERFFELTQVADAPLAMISPRVDLMWHKFIEFTERYADYCVETYGEMIHHRPRTDHSPVPEEAVRNTVDLYSKHFGPMPDVWTDGLSPEVIAYAQRRSDTLAPAYRWSGWPGRSSRSL